LFFLFCGNAIAESYPIYDSGYSAVTNFSAVHTGKLYWLDNQRVLFTGFAADSPDTKKKKPQRIDQLALYIWDTKENKVTYYTDGELACYYQGRVAYQIKVSGKKTIKTGRMGDEKIDEQNKFSSHFSICNFETEGEAPFKKRLQLLRLYDGHGYLEVGKMFVNAATNDAPVRFFASGLGEIPLPIRGSEVWPSYVDYYEAADVYTLYSLTAKDRKHGISRWPKGMAQPVYLMTPQGRVSKITIPYFKWNHGGPKDIMPTKKGIFATYTYHGWTSGMPDVGTKMNPALMGGYLVQGKTYKKLIDGWVYAKGLSPDGCKLALGISSPKFPESPARLMMVDVCSES
jgi:hypothetical protein